MYIYIRINTYIHIYIHIHINAHICTYIHTHTLVGDCVCKTTLQILQNSTIYGGCKRTLFMGLLLFFLNVSRAHSTLSHSRCNITGWRRCIGCLRLHVRLQVISRQTATNYRTLLRKRTRKDAVSSPTCSDILSLSSLSHSLSHSLSLLSLSLPLSLSSSLSLSLSSTLFLSLPLFPCLSHSLPLFFSFSLFLSLSLSRPLLLSLSSLRANTSIRARALSCARALCLLCACALSRCVSLACSLSLSCARAHLGYESAP